jgi:transcription elongation factor GreA
MGGAATSGDGDAMVHDTVTALDPRRSQPARVMLTQVDFDATSRELETLRAAYRENLASLEDVTIDALRIAHLERLLASATVAEAGQVGGAGTVGSVVRVRKASGAVVDYTIVGRRGPGSPPTHVTPGSPVGEALCGARPGDDVVVTLPSGRVHRLRVLQVE